MTLIDATHMPTARPSLREGPPATPAPLEPIHPLLAPERGSEDQHATRREAEVCGPILDHGHLIGSQGVPSFLKVTGIGVCMHGLRGLGRLGRTTTLTASHPFVSTTFLVALHSLPEIP